MKKGQSGVKKEKESKEKKKKLNFKRPKKQSENKWPKKQSKKKLEVINGGEDVLFSMGGKLEDWTGVKTSEMVCDPDGRKILVWVLKLDNIDEQVKAIIEDQLESAYE